MPEGRKYGGRVKGTPNRFTALRNSFLDAFNSKEIGGMSGLIAWGKKEKNRKDFYRMIAIMLPKNVTVDMEHSGSITHTHIKQEIEFPLVTQQLERLDDKSDIL